MATTLETLRTSIAEEFTELPASIIDTICTIYLADPEGFDKAVRELGKVLPKPGQQEVVLTNMEVVPQGSEAYRKIIAEKFRPQQDVVAVPGPDGGDPEPGAALPLPEAGVQQEAA